MVRVRSIGVRGFQGFKVVLLVCCRGALQVRLLRLSLASLRSYEDDVVRHISPRPAGPMSEDSLPVSVEAAPAGG